jgi:hypothetical protein
VPVFGSSGLCAHQGAAAATDAIRLGAVSFERRPACLDLSVYPYLPAPTVKTTSAADYAALVSGGTA